MSDTDPNDQSLTASAAQVLTDLKELIGDSRQRIAQSNNYQLTMTYWRVGKRLLTENLTEGRGEYGRKVLESSSRELVSEYGNGFSYAALTRMVRFAEFFPDEQILATQSQELSWSHFVAILPVSVESSQHRNHERRTIERSGGGWRTDGMVASRVIVGNRSRHIPCAVEPCAELCSVENIPAEIHRINRSSRYSDTTRSVLLAGVIGDGTWNVPTTLEDGQ